MICSLIRCIWFTVHKCNGHSIWLEGNIINLIQFLMQSYRIALKHWEYNTSDINQLYDSFMVLLCRIWNLKAPSHTHSNSMKKKVFRIFLLAFHWNRKSYEFWMTWCVNYHSFWSHYKTTASYSFCLVLNSVWVFIFLGFDPSDADDKLTMAVTH